MRKKAIKQNNSEQEDRKLIEDFKADNINAFDKLVLKYQDRVFNLCYRILGDYDEANDLAQETFIKVYRNLVNFRFKSSFSTWIYRIAVNSCRNSLSSLAYRLNKRMVRIDNPGRSENGINRIEIRNGSFNPVTVFERKEKDRDIQMAIETLPKMQRVLVVLRDIEGKSYEEISRITGLKSGTVKSRLSRARQCLREKLRGVE